MIAQRTRPFARIECLGRLVITRDGDRTPVVITQRRHLALLAVLAAAGGDGLARDSLILMLWPESKADRGRHSLSQAMYALRREFGEDLFIVGADTIRLNGAMVSTDVGELEAALAVRDVSRVTTLYRAPLFEGFAIADAHELNEWVVDKREDVLTRVLALLEETPDSDLSYRELIRGWRRVAVAEKGNDRVARGLTRALDKPPREPARRLSGRVMAGAAAAVAAALVLGVLLTKSRSGDSGASVDPNAPLVVAVAPFAVPDTRLSDWREGLPEILSSDLDGAGGVRSVSTRVVLSHWSGAPDRAAAAALAQATQARFVVIGSLLPVGSDSMSVDARLFDARGGRTADLPRRNGAIRRSRELVDSVAVDILREIGRRAPVGAVRSATFNTARSFDALKAYLDGEQVYRRAQWDSARVFYEHALALDSLFAPAHRRLGITLGFYRFGVDSESTMHLLRAGELNHGLSLRDSLLFLADSLQAAAEGLFPNEAQWPLLRRLIPLGERLVERYPDDPEAWLALGEARFHFGYGSLLSVTDSAVLVPFDKAIALDSGFALGYQHAMQLALQVHGPDWAAAYGLAFQRHVAGSAGNSIPLALRVLEARGRFADVRPLVLGSPKDVVNSAYNIIRRWRDSAESAAWLVVRIDSARSADPAGEIGRSSVRRATAAELAYRGHLSAAARTIGFDTAQVSAELCYFAAIELLPRDAAVCHTDGTRWFTFILPALAETGDTAQLARFVAARRGAAKTARPANAIASAAYDTLAGTAFLTLARHDTVRARQLLDALPDTQCTYCYLHRLTRARLRTSGKAKEFNERLLEVLSPVEVVQALWAARAAKQTGDVATARAKYTIVRDAWLNPDPPLRRFVEEARGYLGR